MQEVEESFSYTTLFLLRINLLFGEKRNLPLVNAIEGRRILETITREDYICFKEINAQTEFMKFLEECGDILYYKNGYIILNEDATVHNIDEKINNMFVGRYIDYDVRIFKYLKILKPIDYIYRFYSLEKEIEKIYMNNIDFKNNKKIEGLFGKRKQMLDEIKSLGEDYIEMISTLQDQLYEKLKDEFLIYPFDVTKYELSDHFDEKTDLVQLIDIPSQSAIFKYGPLYMTKVKYDIDNILDFESEESINDTSDYELDSTEEYYDATFDSYEEDDDFDDDYEEYDEDEYQATRIEDAFPSGLDVTCNFSIKETIFSLQYIKILEIMKERYNNSSKEIDRLMQRLKYLNDNIDINLYKCTSSDLNYILNEYKMQDDMDFLMFADEVMYFINEIFTSYYDRFWLQKIIFIKTYYELTSDMEIINYINEFKDSIMYNQVYEIITGNAPGKTKSKK